MSGSSNFLVFDENALSMKSDADYSADGTRINGVSAGMASVELHNKLYRQVSVMVAALAQWMADQGQVVSDSDLAALTTVVANTIAKKSEFAAHLADETTNHIPKSILTAAGDILVASGSETPARLAIGAALQILRVKSDESGLEYADPLKTASGTWSDTTTSIPAGKTYTKTIPLGFRAKRGRLIIGGYLQGGYYVQFNDNQLDTVSINNVSNATSLNYKVTISAFLDAGAGAIDVGYIRLLDVYISGTNLVIVVKNTNTNSATLVINKALWEVEG